MASIKELEKNKIEIEFEISQELLKQASLKAYNKNKGKINVPGFRKGHAPKAVIEQFYGKNVFFEDTFEIAFPDAYSAALDEKDVFAVSRPENVDIISMEEGKPMVVKAELYVKPEVELGDYRNVSIEFEGKKVLAKDVKAEVEKVIEQNARFEEVERPAKNGDKVVLDYSGSVDGKKFDGGTAEGQTLDLGSGAFIPGFEEQLVGMRAGEEKDIHVTFPEQYHAKELAGKPAVFSVKLVSVKEKQLPKADDEFAQDVSEFDTFEEYQADLKEKLKKRVEAQNKRELENAILEKIVEQSNVDIPSCMIDTQIDNQIQEMSYNLMYQGLSMQQYLEYTGLTMDKMREQARPGAEATVKAQLVLEAIKNKEQIKADEEAVEKSIASFAEMQNKSLEEFKKDMKPEELEYITDRADYDALIKFLVKNAKVTKPAKKASAKKAAKEEPAKDDAASDAKEEDKKEE